MFKRLFTLNEAKKRISNEFSPEPLGIEEVLLEEALDRVLAINVTSPINVPQFTRSTVDGYAVKAEDTFLAEEDNPVDLKLSGIVNMGEIPDFILERGHTVEIATGAPLPLGSDSIVMVENTTRKNQVISIFRPVAAGENVMKIGADIRKSEVVLRRGNILSSQEIGVLAALGYSSVKVIRRPKVAIISTGAEIIKPGRPLIPGKIYDINTYTLTAAVIEQGGLPINLGVVQDDDSRLIKVKLKKAINEADVVLTSGGVSVGPKDIIPKVLEKLGKRGLIIHGVSIKPGKPLAFTVINGKPIFSLPGNPTSALLTFNLFVKPVLEIMTERKPTPSTTVEARISERIFSARGRRSYVTVTLSRSDNSELIASPVLGGESGAITTLAEADGYVEIKEDQQFIGAGKKVTVFLLKTRRVKHSRVII